MVRLIPVTVRGKTVWVEDAPTHCAAGHEWLLPGRDGCPVCGEPVRVWKCAEPGCVAPMLYDDEHVHGSRR
jgi:hypothetical protein